MDAPRATPDRARPVSPGGHASGETELEALVRFVRASRRLLVLTGAGCSTESGVPDYRDHEGEWKHRRPVQYRDFLHDPGVRRRYWARSLLGWPRISAAPPNAGHQALAALEAAGHLHCLITQNVDGLHQKAGSRRVIDLHGRLDTVACLSCGDRVSRELLQGELRRLNPGWCELDGSLAPDGDVDLEDADHERFRVIDCARCGGVLKPMVVFFGEAVPRPRVQAALERFEQADALLVVGSSLMVWSGYRFVRAAARRGLPAALVNLGRTRGDAEITLKVVARCGEILPRLATRLSVASSAS